MRFECIIQTNLDNPKYYGIPAIPGRIASVVNPHVCGRHKVIRGREGQKEREREREHTNPNPSLL